MIIMLTSGSHFFHWKMIEHMMVQIECVIRLTQSLGGGCCLLRRDIEDRNDHFAIHAEEK